MNQEIFIEEDVTTEDLATTDQQRQNSAEPLIPIADYAGIQPKRQYKELKSRANFL